MWMAGVRSWTPSCRLTSSEDSDRWLAVWRSLTFACSRRRTASPSRKLAWFCPQFVAAEAQAVRLRVFAINRRRWLTFATVAALSAMAQGCAAPGAHPIGQAHPRLSELTVLEIACIAAASEGLQLSEYSVPQIVYDAAGVWTIMFQRKAASGPGNYFFVIVLDADGVATIRRGVW